MKTIEKLPEFVKSVLLELEAAGYEAWCVGGCVRDLLLGLTPKDWDVTTNALPEQTMTVFGARALPTGLKHGTVTVDHRVEITTYRIDGLYRDHRHPEEVVFTDSLKEDLRRRDFTVNAMALDVHGKLRDEFGGREDLGRGILRCVGEPEQRFGEDALRILRGLRFAAVLGFELETATAAAVHRGRELLRRIAAERIQDEWFKLLCGDYTVGVLREYPDVIGVFWPEILPMVGFDQKNRHHCYDVWEHTLHALEETPPDLVLRCAVLLHDIGKPRSFVFGTDGFGHFRGHQLISRDMAAEMLKRLKCATAFRETVTRLVEWHDRNIAGEPRAVRKALRQLGEEDLRRLLVIKRADNLAQAPAFHGRQEEIACVERLLDQILAEDDCFSLKQLAINGKDLVEMGLEGPEIGRMLEWLLDRVVEGEIPNDRETLLGLARRFAEVR